MNTRIVALCVALFAAAPLATAATVTTVFEDTLNLASTSVPASNAFVNHIPDIGNGGLPWTGINANGLTITASTPNYVETQGNQRTFSATLAAPLGPGGTLTEQINELQTSGNFFNGYTGFTLEAGNTPVAFIGHVNGTGANWSLDSSETNTGGAIAASSAITAPQLATLTYVYNTGATTLTLVGAQGTETITGTLAADQAINTIFFDNNGGADQRFGDSLTGTPAILVTITTTPEPGSLAALAGIGGMGLIGIVWRRRRRHA